jgi:hypothetical protein
VQYRLSGGFPCQPLSGKLLRTIWKAPDQGTALVRRILTKCWTAWHNAAAIKLNADDPRKMRSVRFVECLLCRSGEEETIHDSVTLRC